MNEKQLGKHGICSLISINRTEMNVIQEFMKIETYGDFLKVVSDNEA